MGSRDLNSEQCGSRIWVMANFTKLFSFFFLSRLFELTQMFSEGFPSLRGLLNHGSSNKRQ